MKRTILNLILVALFCLPAHAIACDYPEKPKLPDGNSATKEDMIAAQGAVKSFLAAVDEYLSCIEQEEKDAVKAMDDPDDSEVQRREDLLNKRFEAANEEKFLFGEQWNQQVRSYNARRTGEGSR